MSKMIKLLATGLAVVSMSSMTNYAVLAAPYNNKEFELAQPDGTRVSVSITGDEYYQHIESPDGYTLIRDENGWICYAELNADQTEYVSTGTVYNTSSEQRSTDEPQRGGGGLQKHLKIKSDAIREQADEVRNRLHGNDFKNTPKSENSFENSLLDSKVAASGDVKGLTILVDFPDKKSDISQSEIERFFNETGYRGFNNNGSVRDYYYDVSGGRVTYTNNLIGFYTVKHPKTYYDDIYEQTGSYAKSNEFAEEVFQWLKSSGYNLSSLTTDSKGYLKAVNILYAGTPDAGWAKGLWPHQAWYPKSDYINGARIQKYEMTNIGRDLSLYTICHESGHMIYGYPDLYDYDGDSQGTGMYSLMSTVANDKNPVPPDPYCRNVISRWNLPINMNEYNAGTKFAAVADGNGNSYTYKWSGNQSNEYFLIENLQKTGRYADLPDAGLAIWHIDEKGNNSRNEMTPSNHYLVSLEQADGNYDMERNRNGGNRGDLFRKGYKDSFTSSTTPNSKWWNQSASGLEISQISNAGSEMTFVQASNGQNPNPDPDPDPTPQQKNIAGLATPTASYVSDWESILALNDGIDPTSSNDRSGAVYGNWPETGSQWVQYTFNETHTITGSDIYWFKDGQGIDVPASYRMYYWDGSAWQDIKNPKGLGTKTNQYNTTTFTPVTTYAISIVMESKGTSSTGILEWKVYGN